MHVRAGDGVQTRASRHAHLSRSPGASSTDINIFSFLKNDKQTKGVKVL
jgi:hypothetical protein